MRLLLALNLLALMASSSFAETDLLAGWSLHGSGRFAAFNYEYAQLVPDRIGQTWIGTMADLRLERKLGEDAALSLGVIGQIQADNVRLAAVWPWIQVALLPRQHHRIELGSLTLDQPWAPVVFDGWNFLLRPAAFGGRWKFSSEHRFLEVIADWEKFNLVDSRERVSLGALGHFEIADVSLDPQFRLKHIGGELFHTAESIQNLTHWVAGTTLGFSPRLESNWRVTGEVLGFLSRGSPSSGGVVSDALGWGMGPRATVGWGPWGFRLEQWWANGFYAFDGQPVYRLGRVFTVGVDLDWKFAQDALALQLQFNQRWTSVGFLLDEIVMLKWGF